MRALVCGSRLWDDEATAYLFPQESRSADEPPFHCGCRCHHGGDGVPCRSTPRQPERIISGGQTGADQTPEPRLTPAEKQALLERERARMAEPGYRESLIPPPDLSEPRAVRPLPDWMPTPEELDVYFTPNDVLVRAVRWLLEERENR